MTAGDPTPRPGPGGGPAGGFGGPVGGGDGGRPTAPRPGPRPGPTSGVGPGAGPAAPGDLGDGELPHGATGGDDGDAEVAQVLVDLAGTPADAPPLEQAAALERAQERLARRLSGTTR